MINAAWFSERLTRLRLDKGVSARDMSLSLGQSESYINKIENGHTLPSMSGFFMICDYLGVSPKDFFDDETNNPRKTNLLYDSINNLSEKQILHVQQLVDDLLEK